MAYYLIGAILVIYYNIAANSLPIPYVTEHLEESLEDVLKKGQGARGAIIPESVKASTDAKTNVFKIVKDFIGNEDDVKRTLFFCKEGLCKILSDDDLNADDTTTDGIIKAQRKKLTKKISEEKIKEIYKAKESDILTFDATHDRSQEEGNPGGNDRIKSAPKMKLESIFKGHRYVKLKQNTDPFDVTMTTPVLPKLIKFKFAKTRVPITTTSKLKILYQDTKVLMPETLDEMIRQYQMYPGAGCMYVKGCDGNPIKIVKSPQAMALIAKIYREVLDKPEGHQVINFYLQKYEPQHIYVEDDQYVASKRSTISTTSLTVNSECFMY
ncbi:unnamed protein product [Nezara viridula]|uniref:Uncharacterized protein n=1 Tax=Nezara viridula TaxID=85310 RepID=A0A9P0HKK7_NEZVI|nr:unnamed protein product [Nezara viridula]